MENENQELKSFFTKEEIEKLNLTEEEVAEFDKAMSIIETIELLPNDADKFAEKFEKTIPDNLEQGMDMFPEIMKNDPEFVTQLFAFYDVAGIVSEVPPPTVSKLSIEDLKNIEANEIADEILGTV